jgi:hypothetical protein
MVALLFLVFAAANAVELVDHAPVLGHNRVNGKYIEDMVGGSSVRKYFFVES